MDLDEIELFEAIFENRREVGEVYQVEKQDAFNLDEEEFRKTFRLSKALVEDLALNLRVYMREASRTSALTIKQKILIALRFYAAGSYQLDIGLNKYFQVTQASISRALAEVTNALNEQNIISQYISFPRNMQELMALRTKFSRETNFQGAIGCIDCTHVAIIAPNGQNQPEHIFVNRKYYHLINVQLICDPDLRILDVNARFPGSTHDAFIWRNSNVKEILENIYRRDPERTFYLLGDSGYPLRPWMMTPLLGEQPRGSAEERYNIQHKSTRSMVERCNGLLKSRFRCVLHHRVLHYKPTMASKIINACCVLHNMCINNNIPAPDPEDEDGDDENIDIVIPNIDEVEEEDIRRVNPDLAAGRRLQRRIINLF